MQATAGATEIGRLGRSLVDIETQSTNLEKETRFLVRSFAAASLLLCVVVAVVYGLTRGNWLQGTLAGLATAISMVPEEFPVVLTVFLALGAWGFWDVISTTVREIASRMPESARKLR